MHTGKGRIRKIGPDCLTYTLMDSIVDHYYSVLERLGEAMALIED